MAQSQSEEQERLVWSIDVSSTTRPLIYPLALHEEGREEAERSPLAFRDRLIVVLEGTEQPYSSFEENLGRPLLLIQNVLSVSKC
jgi:hypothetical protein